MSQTCKYDTQLFRHSVAETFNAFGLMGGGSSTDSVVLVLEIF